MIITLIVIVLLAVAQSIKFDRNIVIYFPITIFEIVCALFIFGIFNLFFIGVIAVYILAVISLIYIVYELIKNNKKKILENISVGFVVFLVLEIIMCIILKGSKIICYDEFTAWGLFVKTSIESNKLYIFSEFQALAKNYQSGTAIFQIFTEMSNGKYVEDLLFIATNTVYVSMAMIILKDLKWNNLIKIIFRSVLILLLPLAMFLWPIAYYSILVDSILGFVFAYAIYYYFTSEKTLLLFIDLSFTLFFLSCSKGNGLILSLMVLAVIYLDLILFERKSIKIFFKDIREKKEKLKKILVIVSPFFMVIFTYLSWNICMKVLNITSYENGEITSILVSIGKVEFYEKCKTFLKVLFAIYEEYKNYVLIILSILVTGAVTNISKSNYKKTIQIAVNVISYLLLNSLYILFLFLVCNTMPTMEIAVVALRRYLYTLVAANLFLIEFSIINVGVKKYSIDLTLFLLVITYLLTPLNVQSKKFLNREYTLESIEYREKYDKIIQDIEGLNKEKDVVYYIGNAEIDIYVSNFTTFPLEVTPMPNYLENDTYEDFVRKLSLRENIQLYKVNTKMEKEHLENKKTGNIYIYVYAINDLTYKTYNELFIRNNLEMKSQTLYRLKDINTDNCMIEMVK